MLWGPAAAVVAATGFVLIAAFQAALALGVPWGRAAWGGAHTHLPPRLRVASALAMVVWLLAALIVLDRGGLVATPLPRPMVAIGTPALAVLSGLGAVLNAASSSRYERYGWAPLAAILAAACVVVVLRGPG
jgi:hypothetical protein